MTEAELYRAAAKLLRRNGWCQGIMHDGKRYCLIGALTHVNNDHYHPAETLRGIVRKGRDASLITFNDAPDMTANDAIAALEIAADLAS